MEVHLRAVPLHGLRAQARHAYQVRDPAPTHAPAGQHEGLMEAWAAVALLVPLDEPHDLRREHSVLLRMGALVTSQPRIDIPGA